MDADRTVSALRALAHAHRLAAYRALVQAGPDGMAVGELRAALGLAPATLTAHLHALRGAGLIVDERRAHGCADRVPERELLRQPPLSRARRTRRRASARATRLAPPSFPHRVLR
jgi:DNA-binding transcriptional ArsR family regulator